MNKMFENTMAILAVGIIIYGAYPLTLGAKFMDRLGLIGVGFALLLPFIFVTLKKRRKEKMGN